MLAGLYAFESLTPLWRANSLRWIATRSTRRILYVAWTGTRLRRKLSTLIRQIWRPLCQRQETNEMECWIRPRGWCEEREGGRPRSPLFVVVSILTTRMSATQNVWVSAMSLCLRSWCGLFHSWLQGITSKSVKKSENSLLNPGGCFPRHG